MKKLLLLITLVAAVIAFALPGQATTLTFGLDYEFSGATEPEGTAPWITAIFDDSWGDDHTVRLTMSAVNLTDMEFISGWLFNFVDNLDVAQLTFALVGTPGSTPKKILTEQDAFKADGDGYFDIEFRFPTSNKGDQRFTSGETVVYDITHTSDIGVSAFNHGSAPGGGAGTYLSAAHIQSIGPSDDDSGWIGSNGTPVPEPATMLLFGSGLVVIAVSGKKRFKKRNG